MSKKDEQRISEEGMSKKTKRERNNKKFTENVYFLK